MWPISPQAKQGPATCAAGSPGGNGRLGTEVAGWWKGGGAPAGAEDCGIRPVSQDILSRQRNILGYYAAPNNEATIYPRIFCRF